jgi:energy-converting hydrogenase Eha subunit A
MKTPRALTHTRIWLMLFSTALIASGLTAIFAREGLRMLSPLFTQGSAFGALWPSMSEWLSLVFQAIEETYDKYPFLAYGYDWLAFGHFILSIPFLMAIRDPIRHSWVITYGISACLAVLPFAIVFGAIRGIPLFWRGVDTLFGLGGLIVLMVLRRQLKALEGLQAV